MARWRSIVFKSLLRFRWRNPNWSNPKWSMRERRHIHIHRKPAGLVRRHDRLNYRWDPLIKLIFISIKYSATGIGSRLNWNRCVVLVSLVSYIFFSVDFRPHYSNDSGRSQRQRRRVFYLIFVFCFFFRFGFASLGRRCLRDRLLERRRWWNGTTCTVIGRERAAIKSGSI